MAWVDNIARFSTAIRIVIVAAVHIVLLSWALTSKLVSRYTTPSTALSIELVELEPPPPQPSPKPEPEPDLQPERNPALAAGAEPRFDPPSEQAASDTQAARTPNTRASDPPLVENEGASAPEHPPILMQKDPGDSANDDSAAPLAAGGVSDEVTPAQIAGVLQQLGCQKLTHRTPEACPDTDAFTAWALNAERATVERNTDWDRTYRSESTIDTFYEREVRNRLHWPDRDLFADPMLLGAYNAERIRRGQEPLWSKEMRDGFRKSDD